MGKVTFNKNYTKSTIEGMTSSVNDKVYFASDGGVYLGTGSTVKRVATKVDVIDNVQSTDAANACSAHTGNAIKSRGTMLSNSKIVDYATTGMSTSVGIASSNDSKALNMVYSTSISTSVGMSVTTSGTSKRWTIKNL